MPTMRDIANAANVSVTTVSNVFSKKDNRVSPEVKEKILSLARQMKYRPNQIAKALSNSRTDIVCVMLEYGDTLEKRIYQSLISGVLTGCSHENYRVLLDPKFDPSGSTCRLSKNEMYDGAIIQAPLLDDERIHEMLEENIPFVLIGQMDKNYDQVMFVDVDNVKIAYDITSVLIERGHKKIGFLNSMPNLTITFDRLSGYVKALQDHGILFNPALVYNTDNKRAVGYKCANELLKSNPDISAVVACSDDAAVGLYAAIRENGREVGRDIAVFALGGDDYLDELTPKLSTVKIDYFKIGTIAANLLISALKERPTESNHIIVDVEYVLADSLGSATT